MLLASPLPSPGSTPRSKEHLKVGGGVSSTSPTAFLLIGALQNESDSFGLSCLTAPVVWRNGASPYHTSQATCVKDPPGRRSNISPLLHSCWSTTELIHL
ncbi:uncharacterized [Lates japonicus]